jgi:Pectate lyase superfamily protein
MRYVFFVVFALAFSQFAWAQNTNIQDGESNATIRQKLNRLLGQVHNVKQPPYNAVGNDVADDTNAIQAAVNNSCRDGSPVFIPGGTYKITSSIGLCSGVRIIGASRENTKLMGNFPGFILSHIDDDWNCCISANIESIQVNNQSKDWASGAIRFDNMNAGSSIRDCVIRGMTGIDAQWNMFTASISDCYFTPPAASGYPMAVGIYASQVAVSNLKIAGYDIGVSMNGPGGTISSIGVETSNVGLVLGHDRPAIFTGHITGTTLTIETWHVGHRLNWWGQSSWSLMCPFTQPCANNTTITGQLTNTNARGDTGKEGTYTVSVSQNVPSQRMGAWLNGLQAVGATVNSFQTERDNISLQISVASFTSINAGILTGTLGVGIQVDSASWTSANGGTITYTLNYPSPGYTQGNHDCSMDGFSNAAYKKGYHITCNWNGRTVTVTGTGGNPGAWVNGYATIAPIQQTCIYVDIANNSTIANTVCNTSTIDGNRFDMAGGGWGNVDHLLLLNSSIGPIKTIASHKNGLRISNSYPSYADLALRFSELPGPGNAPNTPVQSELFYIIDANTSTIGANVTGGGGTTKGYVVWNGSAWTLVSK